MKWSHNKSSNHLSPYIVVIDYSPYGMCYISVTFFIAGSLCFLIPSPLYVHSLTSLLSGKHQFVLCIYWVCFCFIFCSFVLFLRFHMEVKPYSICLSLSNLFYLSKYCLGSPMLSHTARFCSFYGWVIFHCVCVCTPGLVYLVTYQWIPRCFCVSAVVSNAEMNIGVHTFSNHCFISSDKYLEAKFWVVQ